MTLSFVSLFAGIGGFDLGFERAGFEPRGMCEIDPHAQSVLRRHWPNVPLHDDVTTLTVDTFGPADVVTFGSPCQDLSIAGKRAGLDGERSGLFLEAVRYIRDMLRETNGRSPRFAVWENVPGAFSSNGGADFAAVLASLVGGEVGRPADGWTNAGVAFGPLGALEWRVLDSQHFGVAQRRRRVFVVYRPGGERAGEVLLEPAGVPGDTPPRRAEGERVAGTLEARTTAGGWPGTDGAISGHIVPVKGATPHPEAGGRVGARPSEHSVAPTVTASWGHHGYSSPRGDGTDPIVPVASSRDYVAYGVVSKGNGETFLTPERHTSLSTGGGQAGQGYPAVMAPVAFDLAQITSSHNRSRAEPGLPAGTLAANSDPHVATPYAVRRLTPRECERLQAFPDDHTRYDHHGREIADTHRYRMLGNAVTVTVANWIAHRIRQAARRGLGE